MVRRYKFVEMNQKLAAGVGNFHPTVRYSSRDLHEADGHTSQREVEAVG